MARNARLRLSGLLFQSADWGKPPADWKPTTGVLIARISAGEYGLYYMGHWKSYKMIDWQSKFSTIIPAGLLTGWWGIIPLLDLRFGVHRDNFTMDLLASALASGPIELAAMPERGNRHMAGINKHSRAVIMV